MSPIDKGGKRVHEQAVSYVQQVISWTLKGFSLFASTPESLDQIGIQGLNLLKGLTYTSQRGIQGRIEVIKARDVIRLATQPIENLFLVGLIITGLLFFIWRTFYCLPILPTVLLLLALFSGFITWELYNVVKGMKQAFTHLNRIYQQGIQYQQNNEKEIDPTLTFNRFVGIIDSYFQQILCDTWLIKKNQIMEKSLTNSRPHLEEQVKNLAQQRENRRSSWQIAETYFPIVILIRQMAHTTSSPIEIESDES